METVLLTGASGFIAGALAETLKNAGYRVIGLVPDQSKPPHLDQVYHAVLGESIENVLTQETPYAAIHLANDTSADSYRINVDGTLRWAEELEKNCAKLQIFASSISALQSELSPYGRAKKTCEAWFLEHNQVVVRFGVVVGSGGIFAGMAKTVEQNKIVPLLDNGSARIYFTGVQQICDIIRMILEQPQRGVALNLQQPQPVLLRDVLRNIAAAQHKKRFFVPIPSAPILWGFKFVESVGLKHLPFSSTNIIGLRNNRTLQVESDYPQFGLNETSIQELVESTTNTN